MHRILHLLAVLVVVSCRDCPLPCICRSLSRLSSRIRADCSNQSLYVLPVFNASSKVDEVDASGNNLVSLRSTSFSGMQNVAILNLSSSEIREVTDEAFSSLQMLWHLDLSYNQLKSLPRSSFLRNFKLETLILRGNSFGLPGISFYTNKIKVLDVSECGIGSAPIELFPLLRTLKLDSNQIYSLPENYFKGSPYIKHLSMKNTSLKAVPAAALASLQNLTSLIVDNNPLVTGNLPPLSLKSLQTLSAQNCSLRKVSTAALEGCPNLRYLHLQQNNISMLSLPEKLDLVALNLSGNPLFCNCALKPLFQWLVDREVRIEAVCEDAWGESITDAMMDLRCDHLPTVAPQDVVVSGAGPGVYVAVVVVLVLLCAMAVVVVLYWSRIKTMLFSVGRRGFDSLPLNPSGDSIHSL